MPDKQAFRNLMLSENPGFEDVMRCVFGIQSHETETYLTLLGHQDSTARELADPLGRDRSNVSRSLSTLLEKGLVERRRELLDSGGHEYRYTAVPLSKAKELMHDDLDAWAEHVHGRIDSFGEPETADD